MAFCFGIISNVSAITDKEFNKQQYVGQKITKKIFPDKAVRKAVNALDDNGDGICSIMEQKNIASEDGFAIKPVGKTLNLKGLSKLKYIDEIRIGDFENKNRIHIVNGSEFSKCNFKTIYFQSFKADSLNIQGMKKVEKITDVSLETNIKKMTIKGNPKLKDVSFGSSETMIFGKNPRLKILSVNGLKKIEITKLKNLKSLSINGKKLKSVNLSKNKKLKSLNVGGPLKKLDIGKNKKLESLCIENTKIKNLNVSGNKKIKSLIIQNSKIKVIDCSKLKDLESLDCTGNQIKKVDLSKNTKLSDITFDDNRLTQITFGTLKDLYCVYLRNNQLKTVDLSGLENLGMLQIQGNQITNLDFTKNPKIDFVICDKGVTAIGFKNEMEKTNLKKMPNEDVYTLKKD